MGFSKILGQETAVATLARALQSDRVHHAYRFEGPDGTGKEMAAFALAQALVCTGGDPLGCERCDACRRAVTFAEERPRSPLHPDVRIVERGFYPPDVLGQRNEETKDISVHQIRAIVLANAAFPPHEGRARVFIIRRAEEMSTGAANALLKTLEEPRQGTHFILLTSRPDRLLSTIRSRTLPLRFAPLSEAILRGILTKHGVPAERQDLAIELSGGSASAALSLADAEETAQRDAFVSAALAAVKAPSLGPAVTLAETGDKDKDVLRQNLRALSAVLAREARAAASDPSHVAPRAAARYEAVQQAIVELDRNAQPSFVVATMVAEMQRRSG
ncbi:MAG: DNA polymerase III subunit delta' [Polyangiaceae bacterium]